MNKLSTLLVATILTGTVSITPALAATISTSAQENAATMSAADTQEYKAMLKDASTMMGHVGIANIALLHNMFDEAADNVQQALTIARKLEKETGRLNADVIKLGKIKYQAATGEKHDYWLPLTDDTFTVTNLDSEYLKSKEPKAAEEDAQIVNTKIALDTKQMRDSLEKAAAAISAKNYGDAQIALIKASDSTFIDETISKLPLVTARDNLSLAKELAKSKDYDGASFALNHAKEALKEYQQTATKEDTAKAAKLQTDISALQAEITKDKSPVPKAAVSKNVPAPTPTMTQYIEDHVNAWVHDMESWETK